MFTSVSNDWSHKGYPPKLGFDRKSNICTSICAKRSTSRVREEFIIRDLGGFQVLYFHQCFPVVVQFGIGVPGCAGLSFTISPPFPYPSAPLPVSSPVLPSLYNNCHSFQSGKEAAKGGRAGTLRVTGPQQLVQPMEFGEIDSVDVFSSFFFFLFSFL